MCLNIATFTNPKTLYLFLYTKTIPEVLKSLVDSGSSGCFVDASFVYKHKIPVREIALFSLLLLNGTVNNFIYQVVSLPIQFPYGISLSLKLFVTSLDSSYVLVLDYNWLFQYSPIIDWKSKILKF